MRTSNFQIQAKHLLNFTNRMHPRNPGYRRQCRRFANMAMRLAHLAVKQNGTKDLPAHTKAMLKLRNQGYQPNI